MGIRFSPGCECCGFSYLAYAKGINIPFPGQTAMGIGNGVPIDPFVLQNGTYTVLVSDGDLVTDAKLNVFTPANLGLPLPNAVTTQVQFYGGAVANLPVPGATRVFVSKPAGATETVEFGLYLLKGSKGDWAIIGSGIKTVTTGGAVTSIEASFTIAADGTIS